MANIFLYAVIVLLPLSSRIVWVFELMCWVQSVMQYVAAPNSFVHSKIEALFGIYYPLIVKIYSECPCQKVLMDLKKFHCSPSIFQCNKAQMHLPDLSVWFQELLHHIWKPCHTFATSLHIYLILCTVLWDSFLYFKMTGKWWALDSCPVSHCKDCFFLHESDLQFLLQEVVSCIHHFSNTFYKMTAFLLIHLIAWKSEVWDPWYLYT